MLGFADIARLFEQIELRLIASLRRNLSAHRKEEKRLGFQWSAWQAEKLRNLDRFRRQNRQILHKYTDIIDDETRGLMLEQFDEGERLAEEQTGETESVPSSAFFGVNKDKMDSLITDITTLEKTAESAALRMVDDVYRQTLHRVQLEMGSGSMTLEQAVDVAVKDFLDKGINCIQYADGRRVNIADYVRMALRTSATRATLQGQAKRLAELGYDTVATTAYGGCSETCEPWQGRAYIDDVFTPWDGERQLIGGVLHGRSHYCGKWFPLLSEATGRGLFHPNCRHGLTVYIDGRTELPKPIPAAEIKAQREREETQRRMEREIRKLKRFATGTLDPDSAKAYRKKLREAQQELRLFIEQENAAEGRTVLRRKYEREKVYEGELTKRVESDIIYIEKERGITNDMNSDFQTYTVSGNRRSPVYVLTDSDIDYIKNEIKAIGADEKLFVFNSEITRGTCFLPSDGKIHIKGNIFPDLNSDHPRDRMSVRAVLAHEYYGHRPYRSQYLKEDSDTSPDALNRIMARAWADEFRASYMAAKNAPNLSDEDRMLLIRDSICRAEEAGVTIKYNSFMRRVLYG